MSEIWSKMYISHCVVNRLLSKCTIVIPHYLIVGKFYEKMELNLKCVFEFQYNICLKPFFIIIRNERDIIKNVYLSSRSLPVAVKLYNSFIHYNIIGKFSKNGTESKMWVLIFSTTFVWKNFHYNKKWARYDPKYISVFV
jgi:hypothetical protein